MGNMLYVAIDTQDGDRPIIVTEENVYALKRRQSEYGSIVCKLCRDGDELPEPKEVKLKIRGKRREDGGRNTPHVAHPPGVLSEGGHSAEGIWHLNAKTMIAHWALMLPNVNSVEVEKTTASGERRADVLVTMNDHTKIAIEVQYSPLTVEEWKERHDSYRRANIIDIWIWNNPDVALPTVLQHEQHLLQFDSDTMRLSIAAGRPHARVEGWWDQPARLFAIHLPPCSGAEQFDWIPRHLDEYSLGPHGLVLPTHLTPGTAEIESEQAEARAVCQRRRRTLQTSSVKRRTSSSPDPKPVLRQLRQQRLRSTGWSKNEKLPPDVLRMIRADIPHSYGVPANTPHRDDVVSALFVMMGVYLTVSRATIARHVVHDDAVETAISYAEARGWIEQIERDRVRRVIGTEIT